MTRLDGWKDLPPLGSAPWYHRFLAICEKILQQSQESGIPFTKGFFSPLDLAMALRGEDLYYDFQDDPDGVHSLMSYCADVTIQFASDVYALARKYLSGYALWYIDGKINMSEDISCMISPNTWREFARPYTQRVIDHFGHGYMHTHSRAMYMVKEICNLNHVAHLWLATDPNQPRPMDCLEQLIEDSHGVCLAIDCEGTGEIERNYNTIAKGNFSFCLPVCGYEEAVSAINTIL
ncbi:hypothetical protein SDC9_175373 [bioreactor metagenome]|uniref:Uroporphyrinogen decarboxylase (URO-D) domain-containing protein n=1 Tax=bioreactor metagenome TaxID=1076179 RepID=A0A645GPW1_9ZZZZ